MSYYFFNENEILGVEAISPNLASINLDNYSPLSNNLEPCYALEPTNQFSPAEQFVYKAELTNAYLEKGTLYFSDFYEAESKAMFNSLSSEMAFSTDTGLDIEGEAANRIKQSLLYDAYFDKGYIDSSDMYQADYEAYMQGPLQEYHFDLSGSSSMSCGEEFIKDSLLTESYLENGSFSFTEVYDAEMTAFNESWNIDYLF